MATYNVTTPLDSVLSAGSFLSFMPLLIIGLAIPIILAFASGSSYRAARLFGRYLLFIIGLIVMWMVFSNGFSMLADEMGPPREEPPINAAHPEPKPVYVQEYNSDLSEECGLFCFD